MTEQPWYYIREGQRFGPVPREEISHLLISGELTGDDLVWTEGMANWAPASSAVEMVVSTAPQAAFQYAGFWRRLAAFLIDQLILGAAGAVVGFVIGVGFVVLGGEGTDGSVLETVAQTVAIVVAWVYHAGMESSVWQATLGKRAMRIKVVSESGYRISFARATGRHFAKIISAILLGVGFLMAGFTSKKQALHDIIGRCLVIR